MTALELSKENVTRIEPRKATVFSTGLTLRESWAVLALTFKNRIRKKNGCLKCKFKELDVANLSAAFNNRKVSGVVAWVVMLMYHLFLLT